MAKEITSSEQLYDAPMSIEDACSMFRVKIGKNEKPYSASIMKRNNQTVDQWKKTMLIPLAKGSTQLPASKISAAWQVFEEGIETRRMMANRESLTFPEEKAARVAKDVLLSKSLEELTEMGPSTVGVLFRTCIEFIRWWRTTQLYEKVYSLSDDPVQWYRDVQEEMKLFKGEELNLWTKAEFEEVSEKVNPIMNLRIRPTQ